MRRDISLSKMEKMLDDRLFFRISRECLVNLLLIERYNKGVIQIENYKLRVARRKQKDFEMAFQQFDIEYRE